MHRNICIHLGLIDGVGPSTVHKVIDTVGVDHVQNLYRYSVADFVALGVVEPKAQLLVDGLADIKRLERELELIEKHDVTIVTRYCPEYSPLLAQIHVPPVVLYCQGDVNLLSAPKTIACVGARKAHRYVLDALQQIVVPLINDGWTVVSGGAAGADTFAHQTALDQSGKTIVVVGTGLCHTYPPQNKQLFESVVACGGLIVSIFPMDINQLPGCFPARNRIVSGLSLGCIVFQAATKSGALITATQALDQGREVFAVPGSIFDPLSAGCHDLIQQGAKLVTCAQDILVEFVGQQAVEAMEQQIDMFEKLVAPSIHSSFDNKCRTLGANGLKEKNYKNIAPAVAAAIKPGSSNKQLTSYGSYQHGSLEQQIIDSVVVPMTADALMQKLQIDLVEIQSILFALSLDGLVRQDGMGFWTRV